MVFIVKEAIEKQDFLLETDNNENFGDFICISSKVGNGGEKKKIMLRTNYEICFILSYGRRHWLQGWYDFLLVQVIVVSNHIKASNTNADFQNSQTSPLER